jgi:hypothetical protein
MGEISTLGWLIGFFKRAISADSFYFLCLPIACNLENPVFIRDDYCDPPLRHVRLLRIFLEDPL